MKPTETASTTAATALPNRIPRSADEALTPEIVAEFITRSDAPKEAAPATSKRAWENEGALTRRLRAYVQTRGPKLRVEENAAPTPAARAAISAQRDAFNRHHTLSTDIGVETLLKFAYADAKAGRWTGPDSMAIVAMLDGWLAEYVSGVMPTLPGKPRSAPFRGARRVLDLMVQHHEQANGVKIPAPTTYASAASINRTAYGFSGTVNLQEVQMPVVSSADPLAWARRVEPLFTHNASVVAEKFDHAPIYGEDTVTRREQQETSPYAQGYELDEDFTVDVDKTLQEFGESIINPYSSAEMAEQGRTMDFADLLQAAEAASAAVDQLFLSRDILRAEAQAAKEAGDTATSAAKWDEFRAKGTAIQEARGAKDLAWRRYRDASDAARNLVEKAEAADEISLTRVALTFGGQVIGPVSTIPAYVAEVKDETSYLMFSGREKIFPRYVLNAANRIRKERIKANAEAKAQRDAVYQRHFDAVYMDSCTYGKTLPEGHSSWTSAALEAVTTAYQRERATFWATNRARAYTLAELGSFKPQPEDIWAAIVTAMAQERQANRWNHVQQRQAHMDAVRAGEPLGSRQAPAA